MDFIQYFLVVQAGYSESPSDMVPSHLKLLVQLELEVKYVGFFVISHSFLSFGKSCMLAQCVLVLISKHIKGIIW